MLVINSYSRVRLTISYYKIAFKREVLLSHTHFSVSLAQLEFVGELMSVGTESKTERKPKKKKNEFTVKIYLRPLSLKINYNYFTSCGRVRSVLRSRMPKHKKKKKTFKTENLFNLTVHRIIPSSLIRSSRRACTKNSLTEVESEILFLLKSVRFAKRGMRPLRVECRIRRDRQIGRFGNSRT